MKIFNWVQRKFHHNALKDEEYVNQKATTSQELIMDGSILSIGTFGLHFLDHPTNSYQEIAPEYKDEEEEKEEEEEFDSESEVNPLVFKHNLDMTSLEMDGICCNEITDYSWDDSKMIAERTTLADLFLADPQVTINLTSVVQEQDSHKLDESKNSLSLAKKLIPQVVDPIKKLNQMLKRMTRKKIHPELKAPSQELKSMDESAYLLPIPEVNG